MSKVRLRAVLTPAIPDRAARMSTLDEICRRKVSELIQAVLVAEVDEFLGRNCRRSGQERYWLSRRLRRSPNDQLRQHAGDDPPAAVREARRRSCRTYCRRISNVPNSTRRCTSCGCKASRLAISSHRYARCWASRRPLSPSTSRASTSSFSMTTAPGRAVHPDDYVYLSADGVYLDAGAENERRVIMAIIGVNTNGDKELLALEDAFGESAESWSVVFEGLRERGLKSVAMLVADGAQGIWKAFTAVFPRAKQQRCWLHKMRNVEDKLPEKHHPAIHAGLQGDHARREPITSRTANRETRARTRSALSQSCCVCTRRSWHG